MNTIEAYTASNPYGKDDDCAKLTIEDVVYPFVLHDVTVAGLLYTLSFWIRADTESSITVNGERISVSTAWTKHIITFTASEADVVFAFGSAGAFYLYCMQMEKGNKATDWTPAPEDVDSSVDKAQTTADKAVDSATAANERVTTAESLIQQLSNCIAMLVTDENGESLMTQTENGWTFSMKETSEAVSSLSNLLEELQHETGDTQATVKTLQQAVQDHGEALKYVEVSTYEDEPCIELGKSDSDFKLMITNTRIMFMNGANVPTYINTDGIVTQNIEVQGEIIQGGFVTLNTSDGGWGVLWKGVSG